MHSFVVLETEQKKSCIYIYIYIYIYCLKIEDPVEIKILFDQRPSVLVNLETLHVSALIKMFCVILAIALFHIRLLLRVTVLLSLQKCS